MENIIKKGTSEYQIAHEKLEEILSDVDALYSSFSENKDKNDAKIIKELLKNYKFMGEIVENFGEVNVKDSDYKIGLIDDYLTGKKDINYVKEEWNRWSE